MRSSSPFYLLAVAVAVTACNADRITKPTVSERAGESQLVAVTEGAGRLVAVGTRYWYTSEGDLFVYKAYSDTMVAVWSDDAVTWHSSTLSLSAGGLRDVAYGKGRFVAIGQRGEPGGEGRMLHSPDGTDWTLVTPNLALSWQSIVFGRDFFLASGVDWRRGGLMVIARSTDGVTWESVLELDLYEARFAFGGGVFVLYGDVGGIAWSQNGADWTGHPIPPLLGISGIVYDGSGFVGTGAYDCCFGEIPGSTRYYTIRSTDGKSWSVSEQSERIGFRSHVFGKGLYLSLASGGIYSANVFGSWSLSRALELKREIPEWYGHITFAKERFVAVGRGSIVSSVDGRSWTMTGVPGDPTTRR